MNNTYKIILSTFLSISIFSCAGCANFGTNKNIHEVTFNSRGGTPVSTQYVEHGEKVEQPKTPKKEGYTFLNWRYNGEVWSFGGHVVTEDMTLVAYYSSNSYRITLTSENERQGEVEGGGNYDYGEEVVLTAKPKYGYSFAGWYVDNALLSDDPDYTFTAREKLDIKAKWKEGNGPYAITLNKLWFVHEGYETLSTGRAYEGEEVTVTMHPDPGYKIDEVTLNYQKVRNYEDDVSLDFTNGGKITGDIYLYLFNDKGDENAPYPGMKLDGYTINFATLNEGRNKEDRYTKFAFVVIGDVEFGINNIVHDECRTQYLLISDWAGVSSMIPFYSNSDEGAVPWTYTKSNFMFEGNTFTFNMPYTSVIIGVTYKEIN